MTSTVFVNGVTLTDDDWFNDVNRLHYTIFGDPADISAVRSSLGITTGTVASTFTFDGSGGTTGSLTMEWRKEGNFVRLFIPTAQATSGTGSTVLSSNTALPASVRPTAAIQYQLSAPVLNNGTAATTPGLLGVTTAGTVTLNRDGLGTAFSNSATAGTSGNTSISYYVG